MERCAEATWWRLRNDDQFSDRSPIKLIRFTPFHFLHLYLVPRSNLMSVK
jgi:hypothetical protein